MGFLKIYFLFIYLFYMFGCVGSLLRHAGSSLQRTGFSLVVVCAFSLSSCGTQPPGHAGSS